MAIGVFEFLLGAVIVVGVSSTITSKHNMERAKIKARSLVGRDEGVDNDLRQEVGRLRERVQVLEKLVTDDDRRLSDEINRLRRRDTGASL